MHRIAEKLDRSTASVQSHIKQHNRAVDRSGFCPLCRRVKGELEDQLAKRG